jgi:hypothetical protein
MGLVGLLVSLAVASPLALSRRLASSQNAGARAAQRPRSRLTRRPASVGAGTGSAVTSSPLKRSPLYSLIVILEAACVYDAGVQLLLPGQDPGLNLGREYAMAWGMVGEAAEVPNDAGSQ